MPENAEALQEQLQAFAGHSSQATATAAPNFDDPEVRRRLHDLGYLED
ncbi:MAG: hypothetical protein HC899_31965 [Leptolyngbyaceae cyanobacterium SM1_4_3]|nr:hypothetical protein [Leptolyngbyaceae cyanobacterium SM1_4_3]